MKKKAEISEFAQFTDNVQFLIDHKNTIKKYEEVKKAVKDGLQNGFKHPAVFLKTIRPESEICVKGQDEVLLNLLAEEGFEIDDYADFSLKALKNMSEEVQQYMRENYLTCMSEPVYGVAFA